MCICLLTRRGCLSASRLACAAGQPGLCERFWDKTSPQGRALQRWLQASQGLFPAYSGPMLRLLGAVSSDEHAQAAAGFLKGISQASAAAVNPA